MDAQTLELWGGPECTVNRVHNQYRDQLRETGHHDRLEDLKRFADLGITSLRYPVLWERVCADTPDQYHWEWSDSRLAEIRRLGMRPIAGLLHHGSGPHYTALDAENFVPLFASYAEAVAERYPWIEDWTPVNEPLTTARFSALYGFWYPHARDEAIFWRVFLNQIDGIRGAMHAIRAVNPAARLVQTEDLGETLATDELHDEARFCNHRRWLTWDLLAGKVTANHPLWDRIARFGFATRLEAMADAPCPPDIIGVNHYVTSNRFLDHRTVRHPTLASSGHVDVEAIRYHSESPSLEKLLVDTWERYALPIAVTESHNGCTRDEQMRWTHDAWQTAVQLRNNGVDVRAITAWSLVGSCDWSSLLTHKNGVYEAGAFDAANGTVRATAITEMLQGLKAGTSSTAEPQRTILSTPGWWKRPIRFIGIPYGSALTASATVSEGTPVLITGATGRLGAAFSGACTLRGLAWQATGRCELDLARPYWIGEVLDTIRPWAVINAAGWSRIDAAEDEPERCFDVNATGAQALALACAERNIPCVTFSSDQVFSGRGDRSYRESDATGPVSVYGASKAKAERAVEYAGRRQLIIRSAAFFSPFGSNNFAMQVAHSLSAGQRVKAASDCVVTATYVPDLVNAVLDLLIDGETGIWHLTSGTALTWADFAYRVTEVLGLNGDLVMPLSRKEMPWRAKRPACTPLHSERAIRMPSLSNAMLRFAAEFPRTHGRSDDKWVPYTSPREKKRADGRP